MGWSPDVIERQLAHAERNKVRAAYNRASYMVERRKMMQAWADYLDTIRERSSNVVKLAPRRRLERPINNAAAVPKRPAARSLGR